METEKLREAALRECENVEVIDEAAAEVARSLHAGNAIEVAFAPGNGTRYCWLFVPMWSADHADLGGFLESPATHEGGVWVSNLISGVVYPVALMGRTDTPAPYYIAEKWFGRSETSDVFILERLFVKIAEHTRLVGLPWNRPVTR